MPNQETNLDPKDWTAYRRQMHDLADKMVDQMEQVGQGPVWRPVPDPVKTKIDAELPLEGLGTSETLGLIDELILPYATGNTHPRFMGWVHGGGTTGSVLAALVEATMNSNAGGREHIAPYIEQQVIKWMLEAFKFPTSGSGILTSGTSMATLNALVVARHALLGPLNSDEKIRRQSRLKIYTSAAVHSSLEKAIAILGLPESALRSVDTLENGSISNQKLQMAIDLDRSQGLEPFAIVGTLGTVGTGAFDDIEALADLAEAENLWLHIDGAFGALAIFSPEHERFFNGIDRVHSLAFDFHKWGQVSYSCGCLLVRDKDLHRKAFSKRASYLADYDRGLASADIWFSDYGPELSRGFIALKVWFLLQEHGTRALGRVVKNSCDLARRLTQKIEDADGLELLASTNLNIVCFRVIPQGDEDANHLNAEIVADLQEQGIAAPSTIKFGEVLAIRCCLINHRTGPEDIDILLEGISKLAEQKR